MKEQLISFETAKLAKDKGLISKGIFYYNPNGFLTQNWYEIVGDEETVTLDMILKENMRDDFISAPTQSLLQKWLREEHNLHIDMYRSALGFQCNLDKAECGTHICKVIEDEEFTYEQALEAGLKEALKRIP